MTASWILCLANEKESNKNIIFAAKTIEVYIGVGNNKNMKL
jgi:hypothetical protein